MPARRVRPNLWGLHALLYLPALVKSMYNKHRDYSAPFVGVVSSCAAGGLRSVFSSWPTYPFTHTTWRRMCTASITSNSMVYSL